MLLEFHGMHTTFPFGIRTAPAYPPSVFVETEFEYTPVIGEYSPMFECPVDGTMMMFEFGPSTPPTNAGVAQLCVVALQNVRVEGLYTPMDFDVFDTKTTFPLGARTPPEYPPVSTDPAGVTTEYWSVAGLNNPIPDVEFGTNKTRPLFKRTEPVYESVPGGPIAMLDTIGGTLTAFIAQKEP